MQQYKTYRTKGLQCLKHSVLHLLRNNLQCLITYAHIISRFLPTTHKYSFISKNRTVSNNEQPKRHATLPKELTVRAIP